MAEEANTEIWKPVPGYPGYEVSNLGRARSLDRWINQKQLGGAEKRFWKGRLLKPGLGVKNSPYRYMTVYLGNNPRKIRLHQAVMLAFVGPCPDGLWCLHNNGNKMDNRLENLRYDTPKANVLDRALHKTDNKGEHHGMSKLSDEDARSILRAAQKLEKDLAKQFNVTESCIRRVLAGRRKSRQL